MTPQEQIAFWRELAAIRGRELRVLRERIDAALDLVPDSHFGLVAATLGARSSAWMRELDTLEAGCELSSSDVLTVLDDLWVRVAAGWRA